MTKEKVRGERIECGLTPKAIFSPHDGDVISKGLSPKQVERPTASTQTNGINPVAVTPPNPKK